MFVPPAMQQQTFVYATQRQAPPIGFTVNDAPLGCSAPGKNKFN